MPLTTEPQTTSRQHLRRKWVVGALLISILLAAIAAGWTALHRFTDPQRVRATAERYLQQFVRGRVSVGSAGFSWFDGISLFDVTVARALRAGAGEPVDLPEQVFSCREVKLSHGLLASSLGALTIKSIVALEPTCLIVRNTVDGSTNLAGLLQPLDSIDQTSTVSLPTVELRDARVRVAQRDGGRDRVVEDLMLTVRARPSRRNSRFYDIVWQGGGTQHAQGHSQIDLKTGQVRNVHGGLPWMSIEAVMIVVNAWTHAAGAWSDLLGLDGIVRVVDYSLGGDPDMDGRPSATIALDDASLSIPIDQRERLLAADQRYLRFEQVVGTATLTADGIDARFTGLFHGSECDVSARLYGGMDRLTTLDDVDFDVRLTVKQLELPQAHPEAPLEHLRFINRWRAIANFYRDFDPNGCADLEIEAEKRAGPDQPIVARRVVLTARGGDASCRFFPYRASQVAGTVEITPDGVFIRELSGKHGGGDITVSGWLSQPNRCAAADLTVTGTGIPIDDELARAVPRRFRKIRDIFRPEGSLDVALSLTRAACKDDVPSRWQSKTTVSFDDLSASYVGFPYQVDRLAGTLVVDGTRLQVIDVTGRSGEGSVGVEGALTVGDELLSDIVLSVRGRDLAFDDKLLSALPGSLAERVRAFHPGGRFDLQTSLTLDPKSRRVQHASEVMLNGVTIKHEAFPVRVTDIRGRIRLTPASIAVQQVTGRYRDAAVLADGTIDCAEPPRDTSLAIRCRDLILDDALCAAAPDELRAALTRWRIDGALDADVSLRSDPTGRPGALILQTVARMGGVSVRHSRFPVPFESVRGEVTFNDAGVRTTGMEARYGDADLSVDFETRHTDAGEEGTIVLTAGGVTLDRSLRDILPEGARSAWDRLGLSGRVDLRFDRLHYEQPSADRPAVWSVEGRASLHDADLRGVGDIRKITGTITGEGMLVDRLGGTALSGRLDLTSLEPLGRRLTDVTARWSFARLAGGGGLLALDSVRGGIYDGSLTGEIRITFEGGHAKYQLATCVHDMSIEPFLNAGPPGSGEGDERVNARGLADVRLHLEGEVGDPSSRRGAGRVEIDEGHMYRLPIMLAILNVINLAIPDEDAFDDAEADFFVTGNRLELKDILLRGNALALVGSGSMSLPDRGLDLSLVNISPHRWARVPGVSDFVDGASRELVELHITGPLSQPTVTPKPLPRISAEIKRLFQKKKAKRMQAEAP